MAKKTQAEYVHSQRPAPIKYANFGSLAEGIKAGEIEVYYENGQVLIDEDEADAYFRKKIEARLAKLAPRKSINLFA
jgi:hypothetical protein